VRVDIGRKEGVGCREGGCNEDGEVEVCMAAGAACDWNWDGLNVSVRAKLREPPPNGVGASEERLEDSSPSKWGEDAATKALSEE